MSVHHFWILTAIMSAVVMQTLDSTIINVALPRMTGELGATPDSISWVVTSYLMAAAVFMPLTGFLNDRLGRKRFLLISVAGFVVSSGLCGIAVNLPEMVAFRVLQGVFGGALVPLSHAVIVETFPREEQGRAMAIHAMGLMVAPIMGPTLGGFLTEALSWRWNFYINVPVGVASLLLAARYVPDTPTRQRDMDWIGFATLATAVACLQLVLDRGAEKDWFDSIMIRAAAAVALVAFLAFLRKSLAGSGHPILNLSVLKDRNLAVACVIILCTGFGVFGNQLLLPLFLQTQLGVPAMDTGLFLMPRSILTAIVMGLVGRHAHRFEPGTLIAAGMLANFMAALALTGVTPQAAVSVIWLPNILQAIGVGLLFVPLATLAFATIPRHMASEAAGVFGLTRSLGMSFGVSIAVTYLNYSAKVHRDGMRGMVTPYAQGIHESLPQTFLDSSGLQLNGLGIALMERLVQQQAMVKAYISAYWVIGASFVAMLPLLLMMKSTRRKTLASPAAAE